MATESSHESNGVSPLLQSHETRLGRVEDGVNDCKVAVAETNLALKQLVETVEKGFAHLDKRFDGHEAADVKLAKLDPRITALEATHKARAKKITTVKAAGTGLLLTGAGAAIAKFGEHIAAALGWK